MWHPAALSFFLSCISYILRHVFTPYYNPKYNPKYNRRSIDIIGSGVYDELVRGTNIKKKALRPERNVQMYFLSIIITIGILFYYTLGSNMQYVSYFVDSPSFILPLLICIPVLTACGLQKDFFRAFRLVSVKPQVENLYQEKRSKAAVTLVMQTLLITGGLTTIYSLIFTLRLETDYPGQGSYMLASISAGFICLLYTLVLVLLLLPLYKKLQIMILSHSEQI